MTTATQSFAPTWFVTGAATGVGREIVEGLSEGLATELAPFGIRVTIVEPGPFKTSFFTTSRQMGATVIADDDAAAGAYRRRVGMITAKLASHAAGIERWKGLSLGAVHPDAAGRSWP